MPSDTALSGDSTVSEYRVAVLPATGADAAAIGRLFGANGIEFLVCADVTQFCELNRRGIGMLIAAEEKLLAAADLLLGALAEQPLWSDLPIIVLSRAGRESSSLADIVPRLGNASVVERPVRTSTLVSLVRANLRARERQYQVREYVKGQERAQLEIREGERRYRSLIENIADYAIFMTDLDGCVTSWNSGAEAMLGYSTNEIIGRPIALFLTPEGADGNLVRRDIALARQSGRVSGERWHVRKDGSRLFIEGVTVAVSDESGRIGALAHFLKDVSEKHRIATEREQLLVSERAARSDAERANRIKDEFLATLSHELRTPLNAVLGWAQVLRKRAALPDEISNGLTVIERNARAQAQIIADLLDMSTIISGKIRLAVQSVDLAAVVGTTVETVKPAAQAKEIDLLVILDPQAGPVRGDPNRLQQVFWNLLTNALKFTAKGGRIMISLARVGSHLEIEVSDDGEGIDVEFLPHIFDRFRQADASSARRHGGLGIGLSIVKQLVELHGGTISVQSGGKGTGATFRVVLPLMPVAGDYDGHPDSRRHPATTVGPTVLDHVMEIDLKGVTVLVVDDEPDARLLVQRILRDHNADVVSAASASEAVAALERQGTDVLISDIGMPGEDGFALIRRIRASGHAYAKLPAIALTAYASTEDRVKTNLAGFQRHLSKPVDSGELVAAVANLVSRPV